VNGDWNLDRIADFIMSSFAGISMVTGSEDCFIPAASKAHITPAVDAGTDSGYHLLVVKEYSRAVQDLPNGNKIWSGPFMVGGHQWCIHCYPNGGDPSCADFISLDLCLDDDSDDDHDEMEESVEAKFQFSFIDQLEYQKPMHIRALETRSFSVQNRLWGCMKFMKRDALERSAHLKADCLTIRCDIMFCNDLNTQDAGDTVSDIGQHFKILLQDKLGSDVTFEVSGQTFSAHRCVLAARSKVFRAQLFGPMTEGIMSSAIQIKDMEAKVFEALLSFIYSDSFPEMEEFKTQAVEGEDEEAVEVEMPKVEEEGQEEEATEHVTSVRWLQDLFVAADRYDIQQLKFICEKQLSEHIGVTSVASALALAEQHHCQRLKEACFKFIEVQSPKFFG
jgi:speckle-type POZ protein